MRDKVIKIMLGWIESNESIETTADKLLNLFTDKQSAVSFADWLKEQPIIISETANGIKWKGAHFGSKYYTSDELYAMFVNNEHFA